MLPFGSALLWRRSRRHLRQSPAVTGRGEHPRRYCVHGSHLLGWCRGPVQATSPSTTRPILSQPRDHGSERVRAVTGRIRRSGPTGPGHARRSVPGRHEADGDSEGAAARWKRRLSASASGCARPTSTVDGVPRGYCPPWVGDRGPGPHMDQRSPPAGPVSPNSTSWAPERSASATPVPRALGGMFRGCGRSALALRAGHPTNPDRRSPGRSRRPSSSLRTALGRHQVPRIRLRPAKHVPRA